MISHSFVYILKDVLYSMLRLTKHNWRWTKIERHGRGDLHTTEMYSNKDKTSKCINGSGSNPDIYRECEKCPKKIESIFYY